MIPAVKTALADYLKNGRPESGQPYVFLRANAPFEKITTSVVRFETNKYFGKAGTISLIRSMVPMCSVLL